MSKQPGVIVTVRNFLFSRTNGEFLIFLFFLILSGIFWLLMTLNETYEKEIQQFQNSLTEGAQVVTSGGIYGTVKSIDMARNTVDVKIARDVVITVEKTSVFASAIQQQTK